MPADLVRKIYIAYLNSKLRDIVVFEDVRRRRQYLYGGRFSYLALYHGVSESRHAALWDDEKFDEDQEWVFTSIQLDDLRSHVPPAGSAASPITLTWTANFSNVPIKAISIDSVFAEQMIEREMTEDPPFVQQVSSLMFSPDPTIFLVFDVWHNMLLIGEGEDGESRTSPLYQVFRSWYNGIERINAIITVIHGESYTGDRWQYYPGGEEQFDWDRRHLT